MPKDNFIGVAHAQVEVSAEEVGLPYFTALRPGRFSTNHIKNFLDITVKPPRTRFIYEDMWEDNIVPEDMGAVGGAVLVERPSDGKEIIYLFGPQLITTREAWETIKRVTGRNDIDTTPCSPEEWADSTIKKGIPPGFVKFLTEEAERSRTREGSIPEALLREGATNIKKYAGREATKFEEYIGSHNADWAAV